MIKKLLALLLIVAVHSINASAQAAAEVAVTGIRTWAGEDYTRFVFDASGPVRHQVLTLDNPPRVVVDILNAKRLTGDIAQPTADDRLVQRIRTGDFDGKRLRVVFDLKTGAEASSSLVPPDRKYGHRLVLDVKGSAAAAAGTPPPVAAESAPAVAPPSPPAPPQAVVEARPPRAIPAPVAAPPPAPAPPAVAAQPQSQPEPARTSAPPAVIQTTKRNRELVIAIDPGHGGHDPGAVGKGNTREKDITLAIARKLATLIDKERGMRAVLVRKGDYFINLRGRIKIAREANADMFISIHADSNEGMPAAGASVYTLSQEGATSEAARMLADRENAADLVGGVEISGMEDALAKTLLDLSQTSTIQESFEAGDKVLRNLSRVGGLHNRKVQRARFVVLKAPDIPSMLVEAAYLSNPKEERALNDPEHQSRLARAIRDGVKAYFRDSAPPGLRLADLAGNDELVFRDSADEQHIIRQGESLSSIADRYEVSEERLRELNGIQKNGAGVEVGQVLRIPRT